ncbi:MAG TPA: sigma-70 family RNA polymerase sigma factor [Mycobacteriales bacterium]|nr:sigma-70 family RNA polymerase sigma factor [Mycobacteriales bacterium]
MPPPESSSSETALLAALRGGDENAFTALVDAHGAAMHRVALTFVRSSAVADEVVQEAWIGALRGLDRFEGRSALRTWLLRIVANIARTHALREARTVPFSSLALAREAAEHEPALPTDRFQGPDERYPRRWVSFPTPWSTEPDNALLSAETRELIADTIARLPDGQRIVITLRDVEGWDSAEVCSVLELSETNQRVLLHRARSKVRVALEHYLTTEFS